MEFVEIHSIEELVDVLAGKRAPVQMMTAQMADELDARQALRAAKATAAGSSNALSLMKDPDTQDVGLLEFYRVNVEARQEQARLWLEIYDRLNTNELRAAAEEQMSNWKNGGTNAFGEAVAARESDG